MATTGEPLMQRAGGSEAPPERSEPHGVLGYRQLGAGETDTERRCEFQREGWATVHRDNTWPAILGAVALWWLVPVFSGAPLLWAFAPLVEWLPVAAGLWGLVTLAFCLLLLVRWIVVGWTTDVRLSRVGAELEVLQKPHGTEWGAIRYVFRGGLFPARTDLTQRFVIPLERCVKVVENRDRFGRYVRFVEPGGYTDVRVPDELDLWAELSVLSRAEGR